MNFKPSAHPIAPAASNGSLPDNWAPERCEKASIASAPASVASPAADVQPARIQSTPSQANGGDSRNDIPASNVLLMKSAVQRKQYAHLISYARLRELLGFRGDEERSVVLSSDRLQQSIRMLLRAVHVDGDWYIRQYPDVRDALARGIFRSAKHHFVESGYFEGRKPARVIVDEAWYGRAYPDVSESVEFGELGSCQEHFDRYGESEGRLPAED